MIAALQKASGPQRRQIEDLARETKSAVRADSWPLVRDFVLDQGGVDESFAMARRFGEEAKAALEPVASGPQKNLLAVAVEYVINRLN